MTVFDFYTSVVQETKESFIFGTVTASVKRLLNKNENENILYNQVCAIRDGFDYAQFNMIYTTFSCIMEEYGVKETMRSGCAIFATAYLIGLRNGMSFAIKNGIASVVLSYVQHWVRQLSMF
ncbi:hypothetical protein ECANGB1_642 [Enterospora canceri]|uniref:Uncharacterized protein n=1 Tax=Enterospora canceri TaxID=1081671 RepID=A0A1Y1S7P4_9MICR|nr:hypothetical protein ECANGB1_642 [Enterospora canceri]